MGHDQVHSLIGATGVLQPTGSIDIGSVDAFRSAFLDFVSTGDGVAIVDLSGVTFIDSTGLHVFDAVHRVADRRGSSIALAALSANVRRLFAISGLDVKFEVYDTVAQALDDARDASHVHALPNNTDSPAEARAAVRRWLADMEPAVRDDAVLMVSELATNAYLHGVAPAHLALRRSDGVVRIEVVDSGPMFELPRAGGGRFDIHGHGLRIVETLAASWGLAPAPSGRGKTVWFEIGAAPARASGQG